MENNVSAVRRGRCEECGKEIFFYPSRRRRFCSMHCKVASQVVRIQHSPCLWCGKDLHCRPFEAQRKYCSIKCKSQGLRKKRPPLNIPCGFCGKIFSPRRPTDTTRLYCSVICVRRLYSSNHNEIRTCVYCGSKFTARRSDKKAFCSRICGTTNRRKSMRVFTCAYCKKKFLTKYDTTKFCSNSCKSKSQCKRTIRECRWCGKVFSERPCVMNRPNKPQMYCSLSCAGKGNMAHRRKHITLNCAMCGKEFVVRPCDLMSSSPSRSYKIMRKFCSQFCAQRMNIFNRPFNTDQIKGWVDTTPKEFSGRLSKAKDCQGGSSW